MANDYYEITCVDTHNFDVNLFAVTDTQRICNLYDIRQEDYALSKCRKGVLKFLLKNRFSFRFVRTRIQ